MNVLFTTCTYNHLARAFSLADSIEKYCPELQFFIGLIDEKGPENNGVNYTIITAEDLELPFLTEMYNKYNTLELNSALKPYFAEHILKKESALNILYLDSDILLFSPLDEIFSIIDNNSILLTPHSLSTLAQGSKVDDRNFLRSGIYNAGFFGVKNDKNGLEFLNWWKDKLRNECFFDSKRGMFAEQLWLNLVPLYFENVYILRHLGCNVAYWNLHERVISATIDGYRVNDSVPLIFYHFSGAGLDVFKKDCLSDYEDRYTFTNRPDVKPLFEQYIAALNHYSFGDNQDYNTISSKFRTRSKSIIALARLWRKVVKVLFYRS